MDNDALARELARLDKAATPDCGMGVGCFEYGTCYAAAHEEPWRCPHYERDQQIGRALRNAVPDILRALAVQQAVDVEAESPHSYKIDDIRKRADEILLEWTHES